MNKICPILTILVCCSLFPEARLLGQLDTPVSSENATTVMTRTPKTPAEVPSGKPVDSSRQERLSCNSCDVVSNLRESTATCTAVFDGGYWRVQSDCADNCRCMVPWTSGRFAALLPGDQPNEQNGNTVDDVFGCNNSLGTATDKRFFLNLTGKSTGEYKLGFDSSSFNMAFSLVSRIRVMHPNQTTNPNKVVWQIDADWVATNADPIKLDDMLKCDPDHEACISITVDTPLFGAGDQTFTGTFEPRKPQTLKFGNWSVKVTFLP